MPDKRILVIDDSELIQRVARLSLEKVGGWGVLTASSGREGLGVAETEQPDAILLDVMMPEMDGPSTFLRLRANATTRQIPVVFLTAKEDSADLQRIASRGATAVIPKPFDPLKLPGQVATLLGWS